MSDPSGSSKSAFKLSVDVWAVLTALLLALLVRAGVLQHVPW
ncbi:MAG TPA: hypothetical protein VKZ53_00845 [Candidatus Angelobacter sp.]|nr:hypothetical protein [Candidatus Angelobacter sp.]